MNWIIKTREVALPHRRDVIHMASATSETECIDIPKFFPSSEEAEAFIREVIAKKGDNDTTSA